MDLEGNAGSPSSLHIGTAGQILRVAAKGIDPRRLQHRHARIKNMAGWGRGFEPLRPLQKNQAIN